MLTMHAVWSTINLAFFFFGQSQGTSVSRLQLNDICANPSLVNCDMRLLNTKSPTLT